MTRMYVAEHEISKKNWKKIWLENFWKISDKQNFYAIKLTTVCFKDLGKLNFVDAARF
jgi:hypothetical protein